MKYLSNGKVPPFTSRVAVPEGEVIGALSLTLFIVAFIFLAWSIADLTLATKHKYPVSSTYAALGTGICCLLISIGSVRSKLGARKHGARYEFQGMEIRTMPGEKDLLFCAADIFSIIGIKEANAVRRAMVPAGISKTDPYRIFLAEHDLVSIMMNMTDRRAIVLLRYLRQEFSSAKGAKQS